MRIILSGILSLLIITAIAQKPKTDSRFTGLDTAFARVLKDWHAAGFAVAVVEKNKIIYAKGFGYKDYENKVPVTAQTLFAIGSCTKAFTASLLGMLREDGKVDFDKPVRDYLPELKFFKDELNDHITLRDMMSHRTGIPRHDLSWYYFQTQSRDSLIQRIQYLEPFTGLREKWYYNNFMFLAQGVVTEKITHKSWEENIREKIFKPLGMTGSVTTIDEMIKSPDASIGYGLKDDSIIKKLDYYHIDAMGPAGSINSSVSDMGKWVITWINGGKYEGTQILPTNYVTEAISSQMVINGALPDKDRKDLYFANYGLGWGMSSYRGHYRVEHGGNIDGFSASTSLFPSDSIGIIVLSNQNGSSVPSIVRNLVADRMLGLKYSDWDGDLKRSADKSKSEGKKAAATATSNRKTNTKPSHDLNDFSGLFNNKGYGSIEVFVAHDSLFAQLGKHTWWLSHYQYDQFEPFDKDPKDGIDTSDHSKPLMFQTTVLGEIGSVLIELEPTLKAIEFARIPKPKDIPRDSLKKYEGEYDLGGEVGKVYLKGDNMLHLLVPGQPEYDLIYTDTNKFVLKGLPDFKIQFTVNDRNEVTELQSIQPNGTFKATRKK